MKRTEREVLVDWKDISLEEAIYVMDNHDGESYVDGDRRVLVMVE